MLVPLAGGDELLVGAAVVRVGVGHGHAEPPELGPGFFPLAFLFPFPAVEVFLGRLAGGVDGAAAVVVTASGLAISLRAVGEPQAARELAEDTAWPAAAAASWARTTPTP